MEITGIIGLKVVEVLEKYCPTVLSPELTRKLEEKMSEIRQRKETKGNVLLNAIESLKPVTNKLKEKEQVIGAQLTQALNKSKLEETKIGACPTCGSGKLVILYSKKTGKRFVGCTNYFKGKCKTAFPLPQRGSVKPSGNVCKGCCWPTLRVWIRGRRNWNLCLNPKCQLKMRRKK